MRKPIPQFSSSFDSKDAEAVAEVIRSGWVSQGPLTRTFEHKIASIMGYKYGVATVNGTVAISLALMASNVGQDETVYVPDLTFVGTANAVKMIGATVKFADIKETNFCAEFIDVSVALNGRKAETYTVLDAAQALGSNVGTLAKVATLSFAPNKIITTAQGGMVMTDDREIVEKVRRLTDHGRLDKGDVHPSFGFNAKFTDIQAALGLSQLDKLQLRRERRRQRFRQYQEELSGLGLVIGKARDGEELWNQDILVEKREALMFRLMKLGIETRPFYKPLHTQPAYRTDEHFPITEKISATGLWLPSSPDLTSEEVSYVSESIRKSLN